MPMPLNLQLPEGGEQFDAAVFTQHGKFVQVGHREECEQAAEKIGGLYCWIVDGKAVIRGDFEAEEGEEDEDIEALTRSACAALNFYREDEGRLRALVGERNVKGIRAFPSDYLKANADESGDGPDHKAWASRVEAAFDALASAVEALGAADRGRLRKAYLAGAYRA